LGPSQYLLCLVIGQMALFQARSMASLSVPKFERSTNCPTYANAQYEKKCLKALLLKDLSCAKLGCVPFVFNASLLELGLPVCNDNNKATNSTLKVKRSGQNGN
jgi:hypothetical protein